MKKKIKKAKVKKIHSLKVEPFFKNDAEKELFSQMWKAEDESEINNRRTTESIRDTMWRDEQWMHSLCLMHNALYTLMAQSGTFLEQQAFDAAMQILEATQKPNGVSGYKCFDKWLQRKKEAA